MKKRDTKKRKAYKYSRKMRKTGHIGTRKLKGGQWWRRLFGAREAQVAPEPMPQPAPQPSIWNRILGRRRIAPAPEPPVAAEPLLAREPILHENAEHPLSVANVVVPEGIAPQDSLPYQGLLNYFSHRNNMGDKINLSKEFMNADTFANKNKHAFDIILNIIKQIDMYFEDTIMEIQAFEIAGEIPEVRKKANEMFDINLRLKRIKQTSDTLKEFKELLENYTLSEGLFKEYVKHAYPTVRPQIQSNWRLMLNLINERLERSEYIRNYILFLLNEGDGSFEKIQGIEKDIKRLSNHAKREGMTHVEDLVPRYYSSARGLKPLYSE